MRTIVGLKTTGGYEHTFFCPNSDICHLVGKAINEKGWKLVGSRSLTDKEYFIRKMDVRVKELEESISALEDLEFMGGGCAKDHLRKVLLDNIYTQIGILMSMLRRNYKKHYGYDDQHIREVLEQWEERSDY